MEHVEDLVLGDFHRSSFLLYRVQWEPSTSIRSLRICSDTCSSPASTSLSRRTRSLGTVRFSTTGSASLRVTSCSDSVISGPAIASSMFSSVIGSRSTRASSRLTGTVCWTSSVSTYFFRRVRPRSRSAVPTRTSSSERVMASALLRDPPLVSRVVASGRPLVEPISEYCSPDLIKLADLLAIAVDHRAAAPLINLRDLAHDTPPSLHPA